MLDHGQASIVEAAAALGSPESLGYSRISSCAIQQRGSRSGFRSRSLGKVFVDLAPGFLLRFVENMPAYKGTFDARRQTRLPQSERREFIRSG